MKKNFFLILCFLLSVQAILFAQKPRNPESLAIDAYTHQIDSITANSRYYTYDFTLDSIQVTLQIQHNKATAMCYFTQSKAQLNAYFYTNSSGLVCVRNGENQPKAGANNIGRFTVFYYNSNKIFDATYYEIISPCISTPNPFNTPPDPDDRYKIPSDFLKKLNFILYNNIEQQRRLHEHTVSNKIP